MSPTTIIWIVAITFSAALGAGVFYTYHHAIIRAEKAEQDAKEWKESAESKQQTIDELKEDKSKREVAGARREGARAAAEDIRRAVANELENARKTDPAVRTWADQPVPDAVTAGLRNEWAGKGSTAGTVPAVPQPAPANANPRATGNVPK